MRPKHPRALWIAAIAVSIVCVAGLAYGLVTEWHTEPDRQLVRTEGRAGNGGFGLGVLVGIGGGIAIGSLLALRKR